MRVKHILIEDPQKTSQQANKPSKLSPSQAFLKKITNQIFNQADFLDLCRQDEILCCFALDVCTWSDFAKIGLDLVRSPSQNAQDGGKIYLGSQVRKWREQVYCFVDLETTDPNPSRGNVLEIGAILCNGAGEVLGNFESLVKNLEIPPIIGEITGIQQEEVQNAPEIKEVLKEFREFLGTAIFVAHNVRFDYGFLDALYQRHFGIGLYNQSLCTIKMAQKLIQSPKFSLAFLNEFLCIHTPISHRAYPDAYTCKEIFLSICQNLPRGIRSAQNLLNFCR